MEFHDITQRITSELNLSLLISDKKKHYSFALDDVPIHLFGSENYLFMSGLSGFININNVDVLSQLLSENLIGHNKFGINFSLTVNNQLQISAKRDLSTTSYCEAMDTLAALVTYVKHWRKVLGRVNN